MRSGRGLWPKLHSFLELCCLHGLGQNGVEGEKLHSGLVDTNDLHLNLLSCPEAKKKKGGLRMVQLLSCGNCPPVWSRSKFWSKQLGSNVCAHFSSVTSSRVPAISLRCVALPAVCMDLAWFWGGCRIHASLVHAEFIALSPLTCLGITAAPRFLTWGRELSGCSWMLFASPPESLKNTMTEGGEGSSLNSLIGIFPQAVYDLPLYK